MIFLRKLSEYLSIVSKKRPDMYRAYEIIKIQKQLEKGQCSGIVALWLYYKNRKKEKYFYDSFMNPVLAWDGQERTLSKELEGTIEYALSATRWTHVDSSLRLDLNNENKAQEGVPVNQTDYEVLLGLIKQDSYPDLRKEYEIAFVFTKDELENFLKDFSINKLFRLGSGAHAIGLFFDEIKQEFILFDPNGFVSPENENERVFEKNFSLDRVGNLVENLQNAFSYNLDSNAIGVTISIFDNAQKPLPIYLNRQQRITQLLDNRFQNNKDLNLSAVNSHNNTTALHYAARAGHLDVVEFLINKGAKINALTTKGGTPIDFASNQGNYLVVKTVLDYGKKQNLIDAKILNAALLNAVLREHLNIVKLLLDEGANLEQTPKKEFNALHAAAREGNIAILETLLNVPGGKELINEHYVEGGIEKSPLYFASENDHSASAELLLRYGAVVHVASPLNKGPLHIAAKYGNLRTLKLLLDSKEGKNFIDTPMFIGVTPLYYAAQNGHTEVVNFLLSRGADTKQAAKDGQTPIHIAVATQNCSVAEALLNADKTLIDVPLPDGSTPLHIAVDNRDLETVKLLLREGANAQLLDKEGVAPIHIAAMQGKQAIIKALLDYQIGTELIDAKIPGGKTALDLAQDQKYPEVVKLLKEARSDSIEKAKREVPKNWIDKDYPSLVEIRATYLAVEKKMNNLKLEVMGLSEYFGGLREPHVLSIMHSKMKRLDVIEHAIEHAKTVVHAKTDNIKVNNGPRKEKLVAQSGKSLSDSTAELLKDIKDARASGQSSIQELQKVKITSKIILKK
jgi:ankyrin repeat protein